jgi:hypothetical protein
MGHETKYKLSNQFRRAKLDPAHIGVSILDWKWKLATHKWCPHTSVFTLGDKTFKY